MEKVLEITNLHKSFSKNKIIDDLSFSIERGEVIGLVGPNGAGKTTTLKLITNLIYPDSGQIKINGYDLIKDRLNALKGVAAIIENPGLYTYLSGRSNLEFVRKIRKSSKEKMNEVIKYIGLSGRIDDKVKKYSLGMKQRLALGMCLLSNPQLLILDEPTNGLDPDGTIEFRQLIMDLAKKENMSVLFSSHVLSEVEKISDRIIFIKQGRLVSDAKKSASDGNKFYKLYTNDAERASSILNAASICSSEVTDDEVLIKIKSGTIAAVFKLLAANDVDITDIKEVQEGLESQYEKIYKEQI